MKSQHASLSIMFHHRVVFGIGTAMIVAGFFAHIPMFVMAAPMHYRMVGMPMDSLMTAGMFGIVGGLIAAFYGVVPRRESRRAVTDTAHLHLKLRAIDDARLTVAHWKLMVIITIALIVDVMKPATLGFVVPGMTLEYGLERHQVALLPLSALTGTTVGSIMWGLVADWLGRRVAILLSALMFIGTAICGAMPSFEWNVAMCFLMGASAGGLLPIAFTLVAEMMPVRHRGWIMVLVGGIGTAGGYLAASGSAAIFEPLFSWRFLWFMGLPTGLALIIMNRLIPESPRYLVLHGHMAEAIQVLRDFGIRLEDTAEHQGTPQEMSSGHVAHTSVWDLLRKPFGGLTVGLTLCGIAWGLVNFGFLLWLPANLRTSGFSAELSNAILAKSAIMAVPGTLLVTWLNHRWSSKNTLVVFTFGTAIALLGFAMLEAGVTQSAWFLTSLVVILLVTSAGVIASLIPYSTEIYPLSVRATGTGIVASASKLGGILGAGLGLAAFITGLASTAILIATPVALSAVILALTAIETRGQRLEEIHVVLLR